MAPRDKPPLELDWEVETADGDFIRLPADAAKASNRPTGGSGGSQRGDGFGTGGLTLNRQIFRDYPDLNLLDTWRAIGRSGDIAYEGRLLSMPRTKGEGPEQITIQLAGWMTYLKSRPIAPLIIDRRLSSWVQPSVQRQASLAGTWGYGSFAASPGVPAGLKAEVAQVPFTKPRVEAWFFGGGNPIYALLIKPTLVGFGLPDANLEHVTSTVSDDLGTGIATVDLKAHNGAKTPITFATPGTRVVLALAWANSAGGTAGISYAANWEELAVIGTQILLRNEEGYYVSDIIQYLLGTYYPKINWAGLQNTFVVSQCTWHDSPTTGYDALQTLNNLVMWETSMWENRTLYFEPANLTQADWIIRTDDPGVTVNFQGESVENYANGICVTYSDFYGHTYTLYPNEHSELVDPNENNAATRHGEPLWIQETVEWQCLEGEALQWGRAKLAEFNRPKRPGSFTVKGHIRDAAGHWHPYWEPRSSETLMVQDHPNEVEPRLIYDVAWDEESLTATITVDGPPQTMSAIAARNVLALQAANLGS